MKKDLEPMFNPESVAFIGASEDSQRFLSIHENLTNSSRDRDIYFINPNRNTVFDSKCYNSITDIDQQIDLVVIIVSAEIVPSVFEECCETGARAAIIVSAGFTETGNEGKKRHEKIVKLSDKYDLPFCGPNTYGVISAHNDLYAAQASTLDFEEGNVSAIIQSGGLLNQMLYSGIERGVGFAKVIDSGNEEDISFSRYTEYLLDDDKTDVIIGIVESFSTPEIFREVATKAVECDKPIIILKLARSGKGSDIAQSHTGSITTSDEVVMASLRQNGVIQVKSLDMLIEAMVLFSQTRDIGSNLAVIEISGGGCALFSDAVAKTNLQLPNLSQSTIEELEDYVPDMGVARNPVDLAMGWGDQRMEEIHPGILDALEKDPNIDIIVSRLSIPSRGKASTAKARLKEIIEASENSDTSFMVVSRTSGRISDNWTDAVRETKIPFLQEYHKATDTIDRLTWYSEFKDTASIHQPPIVDTEPLFTPNDSITSEYQAKQLLSQWGFTTPSEKVAESKQEAIDIAEDMGFPIVLKILSPAISHKTDIGGVATDVSDMNELNHEYDNIINEVTSNAPDAAIRGVLVQEMITGGVEMIVGSKQTPFGQAVVVGSGGILVEILRDTALRIAPVTSEIANEMIRELRGYEMLTGTRGTESADIANFAKFISNYSKFIATHGFISESDLNPVIVTQDQVYIVDALLEV